METLTNVRSVALKCTCRLCLYIGQNHADTHSRCTFHPLSSSSVSQCVGHLLQCIFHKHTHTHLLTQTAGVRFGLDSTQACKACPHMDMYYGHCMFSDKDKFASTRGHNVTYIMMCVCDTCYPPLAKSIPSLSHVILHVFESLTIFASCVYFCVNICVLIKPH